MKLISRDQQSEQVLLHLQKLLLESGLEHIGKSGDKLEIHINSTQEAPLVYQGGLLSAQTEAQLFHASLQLIKQEINDQKKASLSLPKVAERILMIDCGRKFYPLLMLKKIVRAMAWHEFTHLQLHFSENEGFRIESEHFPEIVSASHLTKAEVRELIAYCQHYYIEVIPDIDTPGHLQKILRHHGNWQLPKIKDGVESTDERALDILNPEAVAFIKAIYAEYGELFKESRYFHIGADEFVDFNRLEEYPSLAKAAKVKFGEQASGIEIFIQYVNEIIDYVTKLGFVPRVWNDGFFRLNRQEQLHLRPDCQISYWTKWNQNMAPAERFFTEGYQVINHNDNFFYYVLGEAAGYQYPTYEKIQNGFQLTLFANDQRLSQQVLAQVPGLALSVWADRPEAKTVAEVTDELFWLMAALNEKAQQITAAKDDYQDIYNTWKIS